MKRIFHDSAGLFSGYVVKNPYTINGFYEILGLQMLLELHDT